jgi:uncharacterized membrane protein YcaP (DUF421 family)
VPHDDSAAGRFKYAVLEADGAISIIPKERREPPPARTDDPA